MLKKKLIKELGQMTQLNVDNKSMSSLSKGEQSLLNMKLGVM